MFNIKSETKIYVVCPAYNKTGGTELAHQLVHELNKQGAHAFITYYGNENPKLNPAFQIYTTDYKTIDEIEDNQYNLLIAPEINQKIINHFTHIQKSVWWMSVDNFEKRNGFMGYYKHFGFLRACKNVITGNISLFKSSLNTDIVHFYQSEYAHQYLLKAGVTKTAQLSDFINKSFFDIDTNPKNKKPQVLYNPKKGLEFTKKLINSAPDLTWIPIENLTTEGVKNLLCESMVYIDFGNHPGKDRFPREAAICGCCIITGKRGSAKYFEDIPISDYYKFDEDESLIPQIIDKIRFCLTNFEEESLNFKEYKDFIKNEYAIFVQDVKEIISNE